jgi:hypothetical protein
VREQPARLAQLAPAGGLVAEQSRDVRALEC